MSAKFLNSPLGSDGAKFQQQASFLRVTSSFQNLHLWIDLKHANSSNADSLAQELKTMLTVLQKQIESQPQPFHIQLKDSRVESHGDPDNYGFPTTRRAPQKWPSPEVALQPWCNVLDAWGARVEADVRIYWDIEGYHSAVLNRFR